MVSREDKLATIFSELGQRLKSFRKSKKLTQSQFAAISGIVQNNLSKIENGKLGLTDIMIYNLCEYFPDFDPRYILTGKKKEEERAVTEGVSEEG